VVNVAEDLSTTEEDSSLETSLNPSQLINLFRGMSNQEAKTALLNLLESLNIGLGGNREPDEIAERLLTKLKRQDQTPQISLALDFISELTQLKGDPKTVLDQGSKVLAHYRIDESPLSDLRAITQTLECYDLNPNCISLDLGLSRGLQYYTGMLFELHQAAGVGEDTQLCGGGRYDDLVGILGGQLNTPATGFAYGLERLRFALEQEGVTLLPKHSSIDVAVIPNSLEDHPYAIQVAQALRQKGVRTALEVRGQPLPETLQNAEQQGIPFSIVVGAAERSATQVLLKTMHSQEQQHLSLSEAAEQISHYQKRHG
jgi:histidyl-tRNA synthetase